MTEPIKLLSCNLCQYLHKPVRFWYVGINYTKKALLHWASGMFVCTIKASRWTSIPWCFQPWVQCFKTFLAILNGLSQYSGVFGYIKHGIIRCRFWRYQTLSWGWFIDQKFMLGSNLRCDQIHNRHWYDSGHTLLCYLSQTWMFNKPNSDVCVKYLGQT